MQKMILSPILAALVVGLSTSSMAEVMPVEARPGAKFDVHIFEAESPTATILMFVGGSGVFEPSGVGFVNSQYEALVDKGFSVAVMQPPAGLERPFKGGMHPLFRQTPAHAKDIGAVVQMIRALADKPLWLLGTSWGTKSVANFAEAQPDMFDGAIFLSSVTDHLPPKFKAVTDHNLSGVRGPVLAIAHKGDRCKESPPDGAQRIIDAATGSSNATVMLLDGGSAPGKDPCLPKSHHTFHDMEQDVVMAIADFINQHTAANPLATDDGTAQHPFDGVWQVAIGQKSGCRDNEDRTFTVTVSEGKIEEPQQRPPKAGEVSADGKFVIKISNPNGSPGPTLTGVLDGDGGSGSLKAGPCAGTVELARTD